MATRSVLCSGSAGRKTLVLVLIPSVFCFSSHDDVISAVVCFLYIYSYANVVKQITGTGDSFHKHHCVDVYNVSALFLANTL